MAIKKPPRRTAERILEVTLELFNRFGEPNVSTTLISAELGISPGNLYYHYPAKDELINSLFERYERALGELLGAADGVRNVEDAWFFLHSLFEIIWEYRFLYRDLNDLLSKNRRLETHLQAVLQRPVLPAVVYVAAGMAGPGHVRHHGRGELVIAPSPASGDIARSFAAAGIPVDISDNVAGALWAKLVLNCVYNPLSAITQLPYGEIVNSPGLEVPRMMDDIVHECMAVARACGIHLPEGTAEAVLPLARSMATQVSSTAQDLARGHRSEIDHLNGYVVRRGEALGIPTPTNRMLHTLVRLLEKRLPAPPHST